MNYYVQVPNEVYKFACLSAATLCNSQRGVQRTAIFITLEDHNSTVESYAERIQNQQLEIESLKQEIESLNKQ